MTTKTEINTVLKIMGIGFLKQSDDGIGPYTKKYAYKDSAGKKVKGILAGWYGPLTVTDVHIKRTQQIKKQIINNLSGMLVMVSNDSHHIKFLFKATKKSKTYLVFNRLDYPKYVRAAKLDPSYTNIAWVPTYITEKA